jgi:two-component system OmpR family response regulator
MPERYPADHFVRLLLVEDEESLSVPLKRGLEEEGYHVDISPDGEQGLRQALTVAYDLLVVDWRLPGMDGRTLVERLRGAKMGTPVLMLTALHDVDHRVAGLDAGADDYLTKPFAFEEVLARLRALHRRFTDEGIPSGHQKIYLEAGPLHMDTARHTAHLKGQLLALRSKEYRLLELLLRLEGKVATRTLIAERVWGSAFDVTDNAIDVTVSNLRQRMSDVTGKDRKPVTVETVRGVGYRLRFHHLSHTVPGGS